MLLLVLIPVNESEAAEPTVVFSTDFERGEHFIDGWEPLGWSRGEYATGHDDDQWCRANADWLRTLSTAVGYTIPAHSAPSALYGAKLGTNSENLAANINNGYPDPGMDSWVRFSPPNAASYDGMTLTFWYWARTQSADYQGELTDYLCVNINDGKATTTVWKQPSPDSNGWQKVSIELPAGTLWMEWEFKTGTATGAHYPGVLIDDVTVTSGKVIPGPPTSHVSGMSAYYSSRSLQVPVSSTDAERISLYYRQGSGAWTKYVDGTHTDGLFDFSPITFQAPSDGQYDIYSVASNTTFTESKSAAESSFYVDTAAPSITIASPTPDAVFGEGTVTLEWTSSDLGSGVALTAVDMDGAGWTTTSGTSYTFGPLSDGTHTATVQVQDRASNSARASVTFAVDLTAPTMTVSPTGTGVARSTTVTVSFRDEVDKASINITVGGASGSLSWAGDTATFTPDSPLTVNTTYQATVSGKGADGDAFSRSWSFTTVDDRSSITGTVHDGNGNPIVKATVKLSNGMSTMTDDDGHFQFVNVSAGSYTLTISKDGYTTMTTEIDVNAMQVDELGTLNIKSGSEGGMPLAVYLLAALALVALSTGYLGVRHNRRKK